MEKRPQRSTTLSGSRGNSIDPEPDWRFGIGDQIRIATGIDKSGTNSSVGPKWYLDPLKLGTQLVNDPRDFGTQLVLKNRFWDRIGFFPFNFSRHPINISTK
jgi:hypothetical protein